MKPLILLIALLVPAAGLSVSLDSWMDYQTGGDSLSPLPGRLALGGMLSGRNWTLVLDERYSHRDSTGLTPRVLGSYSVTDADLVIETGPLTVNPDVSWTVDLGDKPEIVLPAAAGIAFRRGSIRPGLTLSGSLPGNIELFASGRYLNRDMEQEDGFDLDWAETRIGGGASWGTPWGPTLTVAGSGRNIRSDFIGYDVSWSRVDLTLGMEKQGLPLDLRVQGQIGFSIYDGTDYTDREIADRLTGRVRLTRMIIPDYLTVNTTLETVFDMDGDNFRTACTSGEARMLYRLPIRTAVPSTVSLTGKLAISSIRTAWLELFTRVNVWRGLSLLADARLRETPTDIQMAGPYRQRLTFGPGLEYRFGERARVWGLVEQERTNLQEVEVWWRLRAGLELYPGTLSF
jgi:hypothetical protein